MRAGMLTFSSSPCDTRLMAWSMTAASGRVASRPSTTVILNTLVVVAGRIDTRRHVLAGNDLKHRDLVDVRVGREDNSEAFGNGVEFVPVRGGGNADGKRRQDISETAHRWSPPRADGETVLGAFLRNAPVRLSTHRQIVQHQIIMC